MEVRSSNPYELSWQISEVKVSAIYSQTSFHFSLDDVEHPQLIYRH
jgi:hypothetical protein